jgi:hypothetical protein
VISETREIEDTVLQVLEASGQFTPEQRAAIAQAFAEATETLTQAVMEAVREALEEEDEEDDWYLE